MNQWDIKKIEEVVDNRYALLEGTCGKTLNIAFQHDILLLRILRELVILNERNEWKDNDEILRKQNGY